MSFSVAHPASDKANVPQTSTPANLKDEQSLSCPLVLPKWIYIINRRGKYLYQSTSCSGQGLAFGRSIPDETCRFQLFETGKNTIKLRAHDGKWIGAFASAPSPGPLILSQTCDDHFSDDASEFQLVRLYVNVLYISVHCPEGRDGTYMVTDRFEMGCSQYPKGPTYFFSGIHLEPLNLSDPAGQLEVKELVTRKEIYDVVYDFDGARISLPPCSSEHKGAQRRACYQNTADFALHLFEVGDGYMEQ